MNILKSITQIANRDIADYFTSQGGLMDTWIVKGERYLFTKEQKRLNTELGIMGLNKIGNNNGYKDKRNG